MAFILTGKTDWCTHHKHFGMRQTETNSMIVLALLLLPIVRHMRDEVMMMMMLSYHIWTCAWLHGSVGQAGEGFRKNRPQGLFLNSKMPLTWYQHHCNATSLFQKELLSWWATAMKMRRKSIIIYRGETQQSLMKAIWWWYKFDVPDLPICWIAVISKSLMSSNFALLHTWRFCHWPLWHQFQTTHDAWLVNWLN